MDFKDGRYRDDAVDSSLQKSKQTVLLEFTDIQEAVAAEYKVVWEKCSQEERRYHCVVEMPDGSMAKLRHYLYVDFLLYWGAPAPTKKDALKKVVDQLMNSDNQIPQWNLDSPPQLGTHQERIDKWHIRHYGWVVKSDRCVEFSVENTFTDSTFVPLQGKWFSPNEEIFSSLEEAEQEKKHREELSKEYSRKIEKEKEERKARAALVAKLKSEGKPIPPRLKR